MADESSLSNNEEASFLRRLSEYPNDSTTRRIYADWLDDHARYEQATKQREQAEESDFLVALAIEPKSHALRNAYADWLNQHGRAEEASRQQQWIECREWLENICLKHSPGDDDWYDTDFTPDELLEQAVASIKDNHSINCGSNMALMDDLSSQRDRFWDVVYVLKGIAWPDPSRSKDRFVCGC